MIELETLWVWQISISIKWREKNIHTTNLGFCRCSFSLRLRRYFVVVLRSSYYVMSIHPIIWSSKWMAYLGNHLPHSSPRRLAGEKKSTSYNHKTTIWVSHEYYLNPEFHKILSGAFWVIAILRFFPYVTKVDFKGLISK